MGEKINSTSLLTQECLTLGQRDNERDQFQSHSVCFPPTTSDPSGGCRKRGRGVCCTVWFRFGEVGSSGDRWWGGCTAL